ncbi:CPBP family intramembrane glutamic endopeptidase [Brevibacillus ginsengisoli]|uniref:CPBP family intramembrane glutamic endopeptidase n=1 Tax=Brevibacillus ginsengisoli TaxID=363854 RepID=UPI003CEAD6DA
MNSPLDQMDGRFLRVNLLITQGILLLIAMVASFFIHTKETFIHLFQLSDRTSIIYGVLFAIIVVIISEGLERVVPANWVADGEINRRIFRNLSIPKTLCLCVLVGFCEEWLFRGVIQWWLGNGWTSLLFTLIHIRYLTKPLLLIMVFATSYCLGELFDLQGSLWVPILAHSLLDFLSALIIQRRR